MTNQDHSFAGRFEALLEAPQRLLDALLAAIPAPLAVLDRQLQYRAGNRAYAEQFGLQATELAGRSHLTLSLDPHVERSLRTVLAHGDPLNLHSLVEHPHAPRHGWRLAPLRDAQGRVQGVLISTREGEGAGLPPLLGPEPGWISMVRNMQEVFFRADEQGRMTSVSPSVRGLLGYAHEDLEGRQSQDFLVDPRDWERLREALQAGGGKVRDFTARLRHRDGRVVWVSTNAQLQRDEDGRPCGVEGVARDVTERHEAERQMAKLSRALEQTADSVIITDRHGVIEYVNAAFESITGYTRADVLGRRASMLKSGHHGDAFYHRLWSTISRGEAFREVMVNRRRDGSLYHEAKTITPLRDDDGEILHYVSTGKDISDRIEAEQRLYHMAHHDALTQLPNREFFLSRLQERVNGGQGVPLAVLVCDLDRFKLINDSLGHEQGDQVLRELADRVRTLVPDEQDVARLSGDEFAVLLYGDQVDQQVAADMARRLLEALSAPCHVGGQDLFVTVSVGISLASVGDDARALLKQADVAMYRAKELGRNNHQFYAAQMGARVVNRLSMETALRRAVERQEFCLHYQPQVDLANERVMGVEALLRWEHPERGMVAPGEFIPLLEETRLIEEVGDWVLETACRQGQEWREQFNTPIRMAVNLSGRQFTDARLLKRLSRILDDTGFDRQLLELELTESVIMRDDRHSVRVFNILWDMDVRIAVDDFGTGYSSLSYLKRFPIDTLKIDRSFIRDISTDPDDAAIVRAVIAMANTLNLQVVAEGVETPEQREFLLATGCHLMQGYLCHRPAAPAQVAEFLARCQAQRLARCEVSSVDGRG